MRPSGEIRAHSLAAITTIAVLVLAISGGCEGASLDELLANKACTPEGDCAEGYVCHPATKMCVVEGTALDGGGGGATTTTTSSSSGGGEGGMGPCTSVTQCPPPRSDCEVQVCIGGECGTTGLPMGTMAPVQTAGDCKDRICDGLGSVIDQNDDDDIPVDDEECTQDMCTSGLPDNFPQPLGMQCAMGGGEFCDGMGLCVECNARSDCDMLPPDDECQQRACIDGHCMMEFTAANTPVSLQTTGDCKERVCNGTGGIMTIAVGIDLPDDKNECTSDLCTGDVPSNPALPGSSCSAGTCNASGQCVGCTTDAQCGASTACVVRTCEAGGICTITYPPAGTPLPSGGQTPGDCAELQCNGNGGTQTAADNNDDPPDDGSDCTDDICVNGSPQHPSLLLDTPCASSGVVCDGAGSCVECNNPTQCANQGTVCQTATCGGSHTCGLTDLPNGTAAPPAAQTNGNCQILVCNAGALQTMNDDSDLPNDLDDCTLDSCNAGLPTHPNAPSGSPCGNGGSCDGSGSCSVLGPNGSACVSGSQCTSGSCADGVCCNTDCTGFCRSCLGSQTGGTTGTCGDVLSGEDPALECMAMNQVCDGDGACWFDCGATPTPPALSCPAACTGGCAGGTCFIDCNAGGACDLMTIACPAGFACEVQCAGSASCAGSTVVCPDYYGCNVVCNSGCNNLDVQCGTGACSLSCGNANNACQNTELYCGSNSCEASCSGSSFPTLVNPATACLAQSCALANGTPCMSGAQCASGYCPTQDGVCCDAPCSGSCHSCKAMDTGGTTGTCLPVLSGGDPNQECAGALTCNGSGGCALKAAGEPCMMNNECASGYCPSQDGVCCDTACNTKCLSCLQAQTGQPTGTCDDVTAGTDPQAECPGAKVCGGAGQCVNP
ncbi:MAG: hypothetical protein HOV80_39315 [Polyangiaceae bacterium]|nr:hypothetical protein [Polyangiaceae bacterium]